VTGGTGRPVRGEVVGDVARPAVGVPSSGALLERIGGRLDVAVCARRGQLGARGVLAVAGPALGVGRVLDRGRADGGTRVTSRAIPAGPSFLHRLLVGLVASGAVEDGAVDHLVGDDAALTEEACRGLGMTLFVTGPAFGGGSRGKLGCVREELVTGLAGEVLHADVEHTGRGMAGLAGAFFRHEVVGALPMAGRALELCLLCVGQMPHAVLDLQLASRAGFVTRDAECGVGVRMRGVGLGAFDLAHRVQPRVLRELQVMALPAVHVLVRPQSGHPGLGRLEMARPETELGIRLHVRVKPRAPEQEHRHRDGQDHRHHALSR